jgi:hypothetical protein
MPECFNCGQSEEFTGGLVKLRSKEENKEKRDYDDQGRIKATYEIDERWICLDCLSRRLN